ncbi:hypothetical protein D7223_19425 [Micromonospora endolithica]|uniref:Uncharacterized protein n=1 Tax=Micromonospora endolithica TaxID=230091 RepID=A0A3A9Z7X6_9ACTN|nr:hypothetical protein D7223_19425 [Micromonospora endolithica]
MPGNVFPGARCTQERRGHEFVGGGNNSATCPTPPLHRPGSALFRSARRSWATPRSRLRSPGGWGFSGLARVSAPWAVTRVRRSGWWWRCPPGGPRHRDQLDVIEVGVSGRRRYPNFTDRVLVLAAGGPGPRPGEAGMCPGPGRVRVRRGGRWRPR